VDARVIINILALLATGRQGAREVVAVGLGAAGRIIKAAFTIITIGILRERKYRHYSSEAIAVEGPVEGRCIESSVSYCDRHHTLLHTSRLLR
jgi:hypothetical protein